MFFSLACSVSLSFHMGGVRGESRITVPPQNPGGSGPFPQICLHRGSIPGLVLLAGLLPGPAIGPDEVGALAYVFWAGAERR